MADPSITKDYVRALKEPTQKFLCPLSANDFKIQFLTFRIRDQEKNKIIFEVVREAEPEEDLVFDDDLFEPEQLHELRSIKYEMSTEFLDIKTIGTFLEFKVGDDKPLKDFCMIERHYFKGKLVKDYEFTFPFCIPGSTNTWENIYEMPELTAAEKSDMLASPMKTETDSFYFVGEKLVMHNKAYFSYVE